MTKLIQNHDSIITFATFNGPFSFSSTIKPLPAPSKVRRDTRNSIIASLSGRPPSRQSSYDSQDEDEEPDPNKPYNEMVYVGKKIPSKAFLRLEKSMNRKAKRQAVGK